MHIAGIAFAAPSLVVTNQHILDQITQHSEGLYDGKMARLLQTVGLFLQHIGSKERRWLAPGERAFDVTRRAVDEALAQAGMHKQDIDLLIFASVDRRVLEPATSNLLAKALGMPDVQCFDVVEACSSWIRATQVAQSFLAAGLYRHILIVTAEYPHHGLPTDIEKFQVRHANDLEWAFPYYTVGEGATATVLTHGENPAWTYNNRTRSDLADLCMFPLYEEDAQTSFLGEVSMVGRGPNRFMSFGRDIQVESIGVILDLMRTNPIPPDEVDLFIPHTQNVSWWQHIEKKIGLETAVPYFFLMPEYGNLVSNSIPAGIALAAGQERIRRGDRVAGLMTAAGMSFTLLNLTY
ncbi:MAG: 3-oxoacyl-[acyl-carrier-protein] synthase III C-terminal domain-containing protein [Aquabacterium sp.]